MFKQYIRTLIKGLLYILDEDHRKTYTITNDVKKFTHVKDVHFQSDFGIVSKVVRTVPYDLWELKTTNHTLLCADKHIVINNTYHQVYVDTLCMGDLIVTDGDIEEVVSCSPLHIKVHMYCVEVNTLDENNHNNHLYYTNGILSHNTTVTSLYLLWYAMFHKDKDILIVANKQNQALEIMQRIKYCYENMPDFIKAGLIENNKSSMRFDTGSVLISRATTSDAGRGLSPAIVYCDEFAFLKSIQLQEEFYMSITPTLATTRGKMIITSTPNTEYDLFAKICRESQAFIDGSGNEIPNNGPGINGFKFYKATWRVHPDRDEKWELAERAKMGSDAKFEREYNCEFVGLDKSLIDNMCMKQIIANVDKISPICKQGEVRWYSEPKQGMTYLVALDPSLGQGEDFSCIQVFEVPGMKQVAEWLNNHADIPTQIKTLRQILLKIHDSIKTRTDSSELYWTVENNTLGEAALVVISQIGEDNFPGVFMSEPKKKNKRFRRGYCTTNQTKLEACAQLKSLVEKQKLIISSKELTRQLSLYIVNGSSYSGKTGTHDDAVSASLLCVRMLGVLMKMDETIDIQFKETIEDDEDYTPVFIIGNSYGYNR